MDLEPLRPWNAHWHGGPVTPRVLKHPRPRALVPRWLEELLDPNEERWLLRPGPRQVGKTTSLGHVAKGLVARPDVEPRQVIIAPMDDPAVLGASDGSLDAIIDAAANLHAATIQRPLFLLLDEVQDLPDWSKQLKAAWDKHHATVRVLATGSSAPRILRPASADLHGRVRKVTVHPMKLREVLLGHPEVQAHLGQAVVDGIDVHVTRCREALRAGGGAVAASFEHLHGFLHDTGLRDRVRQVWTEYLAWGGYPATRPGCELSPAQRLERFGSALDTVLARDVSDGGVRKLREFRLLFRRIALHPGGKFEPYGHSSELGVDGATVAHWKQVLEDAMLVQSLDSLKPNLRPDHGADKAYVTDPGWVSFFHGRMDPFPGQDLVGLVAENVMVGHLRRLQFNLTGSIHHPVGYVTRPEVDVALDLGGHWLLVEVKYRSRPAATFGEVGGPGDVRIVATRDTFRLDADPEVHVIPAHELALIC